MPELFVEGKFAQPLLPTGGRSSRLVLYFLQRGFDLFIGGIEAVCLADEQIRFMVDRRRLKRSARPHITRVDSSDPA